MNYNYTRIPVTVQAFQMTEERRENNEDWPDWLNLAWQKDRGVVDALQPQLRNSNSREIELSKEGYNIIIDWGDWLVLESDGSIQVYENELFLSNFLEMQSIEGAKIRTILDGVTTVMLGLGEGAKVTTEAGILFPTEWSITGPSPGVVLEKLAIACEKTVSEQGLNDLSRVLVTFRANKAESIYASVQVNKNATSFGDQCSGLYSITYDKGYIGKSI